MSDFLRFTLNSSVGLAVLWMATHLGLVKHDEDFGQTLAVWGVPDGFWLVLPGLGPSTMRDTLAMIQILFNFLWLMIMIEPVTL